MNLFSFDFFIYPLQKLKSYVWFTLKYYWLNKSNPKLVPSVFIMFLLAIYEMFYHYSNGMHRKWVEDTFKNSSLHTQKSIICKFSILFWSFFCFCFKVIQSGILPTKEGKYIYIFLHGIENLFVSEHKFYWMNFYLYEKLV